jgi:hypothetical protein
MIFQYIKRFNKYMDKEMLKLKLKDYNINFYK